MLNDNILRTLSPITPEESSLLSGGDVNKPLYMKGTDIIDADKLMRDGHLIGFRPHTRFVHIPLHRHNYAEMVYMCQGQTTHVIDGNRLTLKEGELLLMTQHSCQEILPAGKDDLAVNFIILPAFFEQVLTMMGDHESPLRRFLLSCLMGEQSDVSFLHFRVGHLPDIRNLMENLLYAFLSDRPARQQIRQSTMGLLFLHLLEQTEHLSESTPQQALSVSIYRYIEEHYQDGTLTDLAEKLHFDTAVLSRKIHALSNKTYTELLQSKRLSRAAFLLRHTTRNVDEIARSVGYDNISYFHRLFRKEFGMSPRSFRKETPSLNPLSASSVK